MRRTFPWILRSQYYSKFEAFILIWSQLYANANLPLQFMPMQAFMVIPLGIARCFIDKHVIGFEGVSWQSMCHNEDCTTHFKIGTYDIALPFALTVFLGLSAFTMLLWMFDCLIRATVTRYRPRPVWCFNAVFIASFTLVPFLTYCQFFALRDFCFGGAKFIPTKRSPSVSQDKLSSSGATQESCPKGSLHEPLLRVESSSALSTLASSSKPSAGSVCSMGSSSSNTSAATV